MRSAQNKNIRRKLAKILEVVFAIVVVLLGIGIIVGNSMVDSYAGKTDSGETNRIIVAGLALIVVGFIGPLKTKTAFKQSFIAIALAFLVGAGLSGQPDFVLLLIVWLVISYPLFWVHQKLMS